MGSAFEHNHSLPCHSAVYSQPHACCRVQIQGLLRPVPAPGSIGGHGLNPPSRSPCLFPTRQDKGLLGFPLLLKHGDSDLSRETGKRRTVGAKLGGYTSPMPASHTLRAGDPCRRLKRDSREDMGIDLPCSWRPNGAIHVSLRDGIPFRPRAVELVKLLLVPDGAKRGRRVANP